MKKLFAIIPALVLGLSLVACFSAKPIQTTQPTQQSTEPATGTSASVRIVVGKCPDTIFVINAGTSI